MDCLTFIVLKNIKNEFLIFMQLQDEKKISNADLKKPKLKNLNVKYYDCR